MSSGARSDTVVAIHYTLRDAENAVLDSSEGSDPLLYLHGHGQIVQGLEKALEGKAVGEKFKVTVSPEEGYGTHDANRIKEVPKTEFPKEAPLAVGALFEAEGPTGEFIPIRITEIGETTVTIDANHPLAGKELFFDIEVVGVRPATESELKHGHAHQGDGHHH